MSLLRFLRSESKSPAIGPDKVATAERGTGDPTTEAATLAAEAREAIERGDLPFAIERANQLIEADSFDRQGHILKAEALMAQQKPAEALQVIQQALLAQENDARLLSFARNTALQLHGIEAAAEYVLKLAQVAPDDIKNELFVIELHFKSGELDVALARTDALINSERNVPKAYILKARALVAEHRVEDALKVLGDGLAVHPLDVKMLSFARNIAFQLGRFNEAIGSAVRISSLAPADSKNEIFLIQCYLASGDFAEALEHANALVAKYPDDLPALMLRSQALIAEHRAGEAIDFLFGALSVHPENLRLLSLTRNVAFQNGRFDVAIGCALKLTELEPNDNRNKAFLIHAYMAEGKIDEVDRYFQSLTDVSGVPPIAKEIHHYARYKELAADYPAFVSAWHASLRNHGDANVPTPRDVENNVPMIQYWSQGAPPRDVQIVCDNWERLLEREQLGQLKLFDRDSAAEWIEANAPEFTSHFSKAFHYAMESDIFRIAYASRHPCIYMDIDSWPLDHTAEILRFALQSKTSMLYLRAHRPWIANGFFVSAPGCPFFKKLVEQCLAIDLDGLPKDYLVIESTFGPTRYNKVLRELLSVSGEASASGISEVPGCSRISLDGREILFSHEAAVASVKPPFPLGYKGTGDYWKFFSVPELG